MPAYVIDFLSADGPQRRRFTLDDDRPLRGQLEHVLAELEHAQVVLQGGPTDELAVYWSGRELDQTYPLAALGVTADRPLELRMQRRRPAVTLPALPPEAPPEAFVPRSVAAAAAVGFPAGALAWAAGAAVADRTALLDADARLDVVAGVAWAAVVGAALGWAQARRTGARAGAGLAWGAGAGLVAAAGWAGVRLLVAQPASTGGVLAWRAGLWALLTALVALAVGAVAWLPGVRATAAADPARPGARLAPGLLRAAGWGLAAGAAAGLLGALPGEAALWQALGAALAAAGAGAAAAWGHAHGATAVFELEARPGPRGLAGVGAASLREWALADNLVAYLGAAPGQPGRAPAVAAGEGGRWLFYADARGGPGGPGGGAPRELRHDDRLDLGAGRYRFRRRVAA